MKSCASCLHFAELKAPRHGKEGVCAHHALPVFLVSKRDGAQCPMYDSSSMETLARKIIAEICEREEEA